MFVSVTRLQLRSFLFLPAFVRLNGRSARQAASSTGFGAGKMLMAGLRTYWTITGWTDEASMRAYRGNGAHAVAMKKLAHWCDEASVVHWTQEEDALPSWTTAHARMQSEGRRSRVDQPSKRHAAEEWVVPVPRWRMERKLTRAIPRTPQ